MTLPTGSVFSAAYGLFVFQIWEGQLRAKQFVADFYQRLGQIGSGVQLLGAIAPPSPVRAYYLTTSTADAQAFRATVCLLKGTFVNVAEPDGGTWTGALVRESMPTKKSGVYPFGGVTYPICVTVDFVFESQ